MMGLHFFFGGGEWIGKEVFLFYAGGRGDMQAEPSEAFS